MKVYTPQPPAFLTGPMSVLLTNSQSYSARAEWHSDTAIPGEKPVTGQLLARGSKLFFASDVADPSDKHSQSGGFAFIWDVASHSGYVLSDPLQGDAPVSWQLHPTNFVAQPGPGAPQNFAGHPCQPTTATVQMSDSSSASFQVLRAADLGGVPLRIGANSSPMALSLSKVRLEALSADLFMPPDGFTMYGSPEALADELAARQHNFRRKNYEGSAPMLEYPGSGTGPKPY